MTIDEKVNELYAWMLQKKEQQITAPLDEASVNSLGAVISRGEDGSAVTQTITIGAGGGSAIVPVNPSGIVILEGDGVRYKIAHLGTV